MRWKVKINFLAIVLSTLVCSTLQTSYAINADVPTKDKMILQQIKNFFGEQIPYEVIEIKRGDMPSTYLIKFLPGKAVKTDAQNDAAKGGEKKDGKTIQIEQVKTLVNVLDKHGQALYVDTTLRTRGAIGRYTENFSFYYREIKPGPALILDGDMFAKGLRSRFGAIISYVVIHELGHARAYWEDRPYKPWAVDGALNNGYWNSWWERRTTYDQYANLQEVSNYVLELRFIMRLWEKILASDCLNQPLSNVDVEVLTDLIAKTYGIAHGFEGEWKWLSKIVNELSTELAIYKDPTKIPDSFKDKMELRTRKGAVDVNLLPVAYSQPSRYVLDFRFKGDLTSLSMDLPKDVGLVIDLIKPLQELLKGLPANVDLQQLGIRNLPNLLDDWLKLVVSEAIERIIMFDGFAQLPGFDRSKVLTAAKSFADLVPRLKAGRTLAEAIDGDMSKLKDALGVIEKNTEVGKTLYERLIAVTDSKNRQQLYKVRDAASKIVGSLETPESRKDLRKLVYWWSAFQISQIVESSGHELLFTQEYRNDRKNRFFELAAAVEMDLEGSSFFDKLGAKEKAEVLNRSVMRVLANDVFSKQPKFIDQQSLITGLQALPEYSGMIRDGLEKAIEGTFSGFTAQASEGGVPESVHSALVVVEGVLQYINDAPVSDGAGNKLINSVRKGTRPPLSQSFEVVYGFDGRTARATESFPPRWTIADLVPLDRLSRRFVSPEKLKTLTDTEASEKIERKIALLLEAIDELQKRPDLSMSKEQLRSLRATVSNMQERYNRYKGKGK